MQELDRDDTLIMLSLASAASGGIATYVLSQLEKVQAWMIRTKIVVSEKVIVPWPGFDGAGLDLLRLIILGSIVVLIGLLARTTVNRIHIARAIRIARKLEKEEAKAAAVAERRFRRKVSPSSIRMDRTQHINEGD
ncbi:hypothetical protein [Glutamicibacter sp. NPDC090743]|uniref:hypothetical protein n=1 Tax=Glutamicibacter sp. NPDC090743 TaxID=3364001 RepID=UPI0037F257D2